MKKHTSISPGNQNKILALKAAILEGIESGRADGFDPKKHLKNLKKNAEL